jgi:hypothetical protein
MNETDQQARQEPFDGLEPTVAVPRLPLGVAEDPIPYALTARGRRAVAPEEPALRLVDGDAAPDDAELDDHRSVQARALRRAGMPVDAIANRLRVDDFTVRAWLGGHAAPPPTPVDDRVDADAERALEEAAVAAFDERFDSDPVFSAGVAVLGALSDVDGKAVILSSDRPAPLAQVLAFLRGEFGVAPANVRVVLRLGPVVAGDRAVNDWAAALDLPADRFRQVRSGRVPTSDGIEVLVRITGGGIATTVGTWLRVHQHAWRSTGTPLADAPAG